MKKQRLFAALFLTMALALYAGGDKETGGSAAAAEAEISDRKSVV